MPAPFVITSLRKIQGPALKFRNINIIYTCTDFIYSLSRFFFVYQYNPANYASFMGSMEFKAAMSLMTMVFLLALIKLLFKPTKKALRQDKFIEFKVSFRANRLLT